MIYLRVNKNGMVRKVAIDMAFLTSHKKIRLPKYYYEDGLYFSFKNSIKDSTLKEHYLTMDKIKKEDSDFYYFDFPFKMEQVYNIAI